MATNHYVYWLGQDGNLWVNQNGNTRNIGKPVGDSWKEGYAEGSLLAMGGQGTLINDPNPGNPGASDGFVNALGTYNATGSTGSSSSSSSSASAAAAERQRQSMLKYYNDMIGSKNDAIDKLSGNLQNEMDRINGEYNTYRNEQQSSYNKAKSEYDNNSKQNMQSLVTNRNTINDNAARGLRGLMRVLGAMGAGGGSVARYDAPDAVKAQADQENANAGLTYSQNQQNLDTDWGNYQNDYENDKKKLEDWKTGQVKSAEQNIEKQRVSLLEELAELYGNRATYGEGVGNNIADIRGRINSANQRIQDLGRYSAPAYTGTTAVFEAPNLSSYDTGAADLSTSVNDAAGGGGTSLLTVLRSLNKKKQTSPYNYGTEE